MFRRHGNIMILEWNDNLGPKQCNENVTVKDEKVCSDASCLCVQVKPVHFTVQAVVTSSDLQFDRTEVDFGYCSIYQTVISSVRLTNLSLLPQDFGFLRLPEVMHKEQELFPQPTYVFTK